LPPPPPRRLAAAAAPARRALSVFSLPGLALARHAAARLKMSDTGSGLIVTPVP
jgi:hypothetical protein